MRKPVCANFGRLTLRNQYYKVGLAHVASFFQLPNSLLPNSVEMGVCKIPKKERANHLEGKKTLLNDNLNLEIPFGFSTVYLKLTFLKMNIKKIPAFQISKTLIQTLERKKTFKKTREEGMMRG